MTEQEQNDMRDERNPFQELAVELAKLVLLMNPSPEQLLQIAQYSTRRDIHTRAVVAHVCIGPLYAKTLTLVSASPVEVFEWVMYKRMLYTLEQFVETDGRKPGIMT